MTSAGVAFISDAAAARPYKPWAGNGTLLHLDQTTPPYGGWANETDRERDKAVVQWSHTCATTRERRSQKKKLCGNKIQEQQPLPLPLQWKSFKREEKKKPEDQTSLISCHQQRGALCLHPAASDETAEPAVPAARVRRGLRTPAETRVWHRCDPFNGHEPFLQLHLGIWKLTNPFL